MYEVVYTCVNLQVLCKSIFNKYYDDIVGENFKLVLHVLFHKHRQYTGIQAAYIHMCMVKLLVILNVIYVYFQFPFRLFYIALGGSSISVMVWRLPCLPLRAVTWCPHLTDVVYTQPCTGVWLPV